MLLLWLLLSFAVHANQAHPLEFTLDSLGEKVKLYLEPLRRSRVVSNITIPQQLLSVGDPNFIIKIKHQNKEHILSVPTCLLQSARFQYTITAYWEMDDMYHMSLSVPENDCSKILKPRSGKFKITLVNSKKTLGSRPMLLEYKETEEKVQSQSFFMKYWYIIVPVMLFLFMPIGEEKK